MIAIIDYGMGNIHSVQKAVESFGVKSRIVNRTEDLENVAKIILPGVGSFKDALAELKDLDLINALKLHIKNKKLFLGICLGMQLLFKESEEAVNIEGLSILKGKVKRFEDKSGLKVPHIGWNGLKITNRNCPLMKDIADNSYVYFCHSYYPKANAKDVAATTDYGIEFASVLWKGNIYGLQFHPEKSQKVGLKILENFVKL
jgi:glutamine amidotransferase